MKPAQQRLNVQRIAGSRVRSAAAVLLLFAFAPSCGPQRLVEIPEGVKVATIVGAENRLGAENASTRWSWKLDELPAAKLSASTSLRSVNGRITYEKTRRISGDMNVALSSSNKVFEIPPGQHEVEVDLAQAILRRTTTEVLLLERWDKVQLLFHYRGSFVAQEGHDYKLQMRPSEDRDEIPKRFPSSIFGEGWDFVVIFYDVFVEDMTDPSMEPVKLEPYGAS